MRMLYTELCELQMKTLFSIVAESAEGKRILPPKESR
jgi:hypothetical protein